MANSDQRALAERLHANLLAGDWKSLRTILDDKADWKVPGLTAISGHVIGADAIIERLQKIGSYGVQFSLEHVLISRENVALALHNTAQSGARSLDVHLVTACRIQNDKLSSIETYISNVGQVDAFFG